MTFNRKLLYGIFAILFAGLLFASFYFYRKYNELYKTLPASAQSAQDDLKQLIDKVGRLIVLPTNEQPTIATVTDPDKLRDQPFFANAKTGDKVLIYTNAQKAILYDPTADKIVEVAPISIGQPPSTSSQPSQSSGGQAGQAPTSTQPSQSYGGQAVQSSSTTSSPPKKK